jgi:hypothetical protein
VEHAWPRTTPEVLRSPRAPAGISGQPGDAVFIASRTIGFDELRKNVEGYSPEAMALAVDSLKNKPLGYRINIFVARMCFRGIYFPQMGPLAWFKLILQNRNTIFNLVRESFSAWRGNSAVPILFR